jgi:hypothetical protein
MIKTNSSRAIEAAASYVDTLCSEGNNNVTLQTFSGELCTGTISEQRVHRYNPLTVYLTLVEKGTEEEQTFDLGDVAIILPAA